MRYSAFMWPMTGSTAERRRISRLIVGVIRALDQDDWLAVREAVLDFFAPSLPGGLRIDWREARSVIATLAHVLHNHDAVVKRPEFHNNPHT